MADSAFQIQYRQEFIAQFEQGQSWLRNVCTTEAVIKGNQAMFLVAGSGGATAVTRGLNGNIPPRVDSLSQIPATLVEWHDKPQRTEFNIFASQGDGRRIMQMSTVKVMNRKIDQDILGMLSGASSNLGSAQAMTLALATRALAHLDLQDVDTTEEDNMFFGRFARHAGLSDADSGIPEGRLCRDQASRRAGSPVPPLGGLQLDFPSASSQRRYQ